MLTQPEAAHRRRCTDCFAQSLCPIPWSLIPGYPLLPDRGTGLRSAGSFSRGAVWRGGWVSGGALHLPLPTRLAAAAMTGVVGG